MDASERLHTNHADDGAQKGIGRRQLIKASAWATPVVLLAAAAPAAAATGGTITVFMDTFAQDGVQMHWDDQKHSNVVDSLTGHANFRLSWDATAPVTWATLTITMDSAFGLLAVPPTIDASSAGWTVGPVSTSGSHITFTFVFVGSVSHNSTSPTLIYKLAGDGSTPVANATPKTGTGVLSSPQIQTVTKSVTWR